jgi:integrase
MAETEKSTTKLTDKAVAALKPEDKDYDVWDSEIKGFLVRVFKTGTKSFRYVYYFDGQRKPFTIGKFGNLSVAQARDIVRLKAGQVATGIDVQAEKVQARADSKAAKLTLKVFVEGDYHSWRKTHRKRADDSLRRLRMCFFDDFGNTPLEEISRLEIDRWKSSRFEAGMTPDTVNRDIAELKAALSKAVEWELIACSPLEKLRPEKVDRSPKVRFLSRDEDAALRKALADRDQYLKDRRTNANRWRAQRRYGLLPDISGHAYGDYLTPMVLLSLMTGIRQNELLNLRWDSVDLKGKVLTVVGDVAKSNQTRHVPLNREAMAVLENWKKQIGRSEGLVFFNDDGNAFGDAPSSWDRVRASAKLVDFRWHDLRHTFASWLVMAEVDLNTVRELLGHSDIKVTLRYAHLAPEHKAKAVAALNDFY